MSSLGELLPLEYVGPLAGGGAVPLAMCRPGGFTVPATCTVPGAHTSGGACQPTGSYTAFGSCNNGNYTMWN